MLVFNSHQSSPPPFIQRIQANLHSKTFQTDSNRHNTIDLISPQYVGKINEDTYFNSKVPTSLPVLPVGHFDSQQVLRDSVSCVEMKMTSLLYRGWNLNTKQVTTLAIICLRKHATEKKFFYAFLEATCHQATRPSTTTPPHSFNRRDNKATPHHTTPLDPLLEVILSSPCTHLATNSAWCTSCTERGRSQYKQVTMCFDGNETFRRNWREFQTLIKHDNCKQLHVACTWAEHKEQRLLIWKWLWGQFLPCIASCTQFTS